MTATRPHPRSYLFALVDGGGTVPPELGVAQRLVARGHHVTVLADDSMIEDTERTGASFVPWRAAPNRESRGPEHDPYRDWECRTPLQLFDRILDRQFLGPAPGYATDLADVAAGLDPDLVVCSLFAYGAMAAAEANDIPFDVLIPNAYPLPVPGMPPFGLGLKPLGGPVGRMRDRTINAVVATRWDKGLDRANAMRASLGLEPIGSFFEQVHRARRHLVLTSPAFDFPAVLPDHVRYVGPVLDDPAWAAEVPWTPPPGDDPLVLVAMSSTFQDQVDCLGRVAGALGRLPVRGLITAGPALAGANLATAPNVDAVAAAPHSEVLRHASLVVTHGGHGTVMRALAAGVPMIVMHHGRDQADNAARVTAGGAGLAVRRGASPGRIARAVRRALGDETLRDGAQRLGESVRRDSSPEQLLIELESVDPRGVPSSGR